MRVKLRRRMEKLSRSRFYLPALAGLGFGVTISFTLPVFHVITLAALVSPKRWKSIAISTAIGAAAARWCLGLLFHFYGWALIDKVAPGIQASAGWLRAEQWMDQWGTLAVFLTSISPLPETPIVILYVLRKPGWGVLYLTLLAGKLVKYLFYARAVAFFPERFGRRRSRNQ